MENLLSLSCMAQRLGVPRDWLRDRTAAGDIPVLVAGKRWFFNADAVESAIEKMAARAEIESAAQCIAAAVDARRNQNGLLERQLLKKLEHEFGIRICFGDELEGGSR